LQGAAAFAGAYLIYIHIYLNLYIDRDRERERDAHGLQGAAASTCAYPVYTHTCMLEYVFSMHSCADTDVMQTDIYTSKAQQHSRLLIPFVHIHKCMCMQYICTHIQCTLVFIEAKSMCMPHLCTFNSPHMISSQDCGGAHAHGLQTFGAHRMHTHTNMCRMNI